MSMENAVSFYDKLEGDLELQKRISEVKDKDKLEHLVKDELGYVFTQEEMQKVIFERNPELSDEELETLSGGNLNDFLLGGVAGSIAMGVGVGGFAVLGLTAVAAA